MPTPLVTLSDPTLLGLTVVLAALVAFGVAAHLRIQGLALSPRTFRWAVGLALGGTVGIFAGFALVELGGYGYREAFLVWFLGLALGQVVGWWWGRARER